MVRWLKPLYRQIRGLIWLGKIAMAYEDKGQSFLQVLGVDGAVLDKVPYPQPYGLAVFPHDGAEGVCVSLAGRRSQTVSVMVADRRYRLTTLAQGEVALHDDQGQKVHITRNGIVVASAQGITLDGNVTVNGSLTASGEVEGNGISLSTHTHSVTSAPGTTGVPQ